MGPTPVVTTHKSAPRHTRMFAGVAGRAARALTTAASALALAVGALALAPAPAHADEITSQEYVSYYYLDSAHAKGYTGKGVTIALIDGPVELSDPELAGANITDKSRCTIKSSEAGKYHANHMAALIVSQKYGVAPDATLYTYQTSSNDDDLALHPQGAHAVHVHLDVLRQPAQRPRIIPRRISRLRGGRTRLGRAARRRRSRSSRQCHVPQHATRIAPPRCRATPLWTAPLARSREREGAPGPAPRPGRSGSGGGPGLVDEERVGLPRARARARPRALVWMHE